MHIAPKGRTTTLPRITDLAARIAAGEKFADICTELGAPRETLSSRFTQAGFSTVTGLAITREPQPIKGVTRTEEPWVKYAVCASVGVELFYPEPGEDWKDSVDLCLTRCPVRNQCLDYAMRMEEGLDRKRRFGVWAGLTPRGREEYEPTWLAEREVAA